MGMARISDRHLSDLSESDFFNSNICTLQDGTMVYVHSPACRSYRRSVCLCSRLRRGVDEANGLLHAEGSGLEPKDET